MAVFIFEREGGGGVQVAVVFGTTVKGSCSWQHVIILSVLVVSSCIPHDTCFIIPSMHGICNHKAPDVFIYQRIEVELYTSI